LNSIGHRIRDGFRARPDSDAWQSAGVVIVGGGVAGLSAAWRLLQSGFRDFVLLELESSAGGTAKSGTSAIASYPWGAHYLPAPMKENTALIHLLDEMGILEGCDEEGQPVVAEQFICRDPEERVFYRGRWYEGLYMHAGASPEDERQLDQFNLEIQRWVAWRDANHRRAFAIPVAHSSKDTEATSLDRISMAHWMDQRKFDSPRLRWLVDYACRDDYGSTPDQTSAWAGLFYFASRVQKPESESQPLITWPAGNGQLVAHLFGKAQSNVRLGLAVTGIAPSSNGGLEVTALDTKTEKAVGFRAERVIFAAPQFLAPHLIEGYRDFSPHVADFQYGTWMVANMFLKDRPVSSGFPLAWDNVLYDSPSLGYVVATHQLGLDRGPTVFTYYYAMCGADPRAAREELLNMDWKSCADVALTDLQRAHRDIRELVERIDVMRWGHAMIRPRVGFMWGGSREAAAKPYRGVHFANTDLSGVALFEEAFYHGLRAADEVMAR
jgi:protoporphyrinogen oxidase